MDVEALSVRLAKEMRAAFQEGSVAINCGLLVPETLTLQQGDGDDGVASLDYRLYTAYDGTNDILVHGTSATLPTHDRGYDRRQNRDAPQGQLDWRSSRARVRRTELETEVAALEERLRVAEDELLGLEHVQCAYCRTWAHVDDVEERSS